MDCPNCNSQDIEIGESEITGTDFTAKVWYASCHATIGEDVNWGGGYDCEFFVVRESEEALLAEVQRLTPLRPKLYPVARVVFSPPAAKNNRWKAKRNL